MPNFYHLIKHEIQPDAAAPVDIFCRIFKNIVYALELLKLVLFVGIYFLSKVDAAEASTFEYF